MTYLVQLLIAGTALVFTQLSPENFEQPKAALLVAWACIALPWLRTPRSCLDWLLVAFVASAALSCWGAMSPWTAVWGNPKAPSGLLQLSALLVLYLVASRYGVYEQRGWLSTALWVGALGSAWACAERWGLTTPHWDRAVHMAGYDRPPACFGHPNYLAAYVVLCVPFVLDRGVLRWHAALRFVLLALYVGALVATECRGAWLALPVSLVVYALCTPDRRFAGRLLYYVVASGVFVAMWAVLRPHGHLGARLAMRLNEARPEYWLGALRVWHHHVFLGAGTDNFEIAFRHVASPHYWVIEPGGSPHRAHNDFLNVLATQGLLGAALYLAVGWTVLRDALKAHLLEAQPALYAALAAFATVGLTEFWTVPCLVLVVVLLARHRRMTLHEPHAGCLSEATSRSPAWLTLQVPALLFSVYLPLHSNVLTSLAMHDVTILNLPGKHFEHLEPIDRSRLYIAAMRLPFSNPALLRYAAAPAIETGHVAWALPYTVEATRLEPWDAQGWMQRAICEDALHGAGGTSLARAKALEPFNEYIHQYDMNRKPILEPKK